jgi:hypothetical protein
MARNPDDFAGHPVNRTDYFSNFNSRQKTSGPAWNCEDILSLNLNGSEKHKGRHNDISNYQAANVVTNRDEGNKTSVIIKSVQYQIVKNIPKYIQGKHIASYPYSGKNYCIISREN